MTRVASINDIYARPRSSAGNGGHAWWGWYVQARESIMFAQGVLETAYVMTNSSHVYVALE